VTERRDPAYKEAGRVAGTDEVAISGTGKRRIRAIGLRSFFYFPVRQSPMSRQNSANPLRTTLLTARRRRRLILESLENRLLLAGQIPLAVELPEPSAGSQAATAIQFAGGTLPSDSPEPNAPGLGTTIAGITFDEDSAQTGFLQIPPDPIGAAAVGPRGPALRWRRSRNSSPVVPGFGSEHGEVGSSHGVAAGG
jgi:hypothetical protein